MRRILIGSAGLILGAATVILAGGGIASAQQGSTGSACQQVGATVASIQKVLPQAASNPTVLSSQIATFATQLGKEASSGSPALKSAVNNFIADLRAAGAGNVNVSKLTADANSIGSACAASSSAVAPKGAPATGGGSTAGVQDAGLFGVGGTAVLAGVGALALAWRGRRAKAAA